MNYTVRFEMGFAKNHCIFDTKEEAMKFAKHINSLKEIRGVVIHSLSYEYELTVEANNLNK